MLPTTLFSVIFAVTTVTPFSAFALPTPYMGEANQVEAREPGNFLNAAMVGIGALGLTKMIGGSHTSEPTRRGLDGDADLLEVREPTPGAVTNAVVAGVGAYAVSKMVEHHEQKKGEEQEQLRRRWVYEDDAIIARDNSELEAREPGKLINLAMVGIGAYGLKKMWDHHQKTKAQNPAPPPPPAPAPVPSHEEGASQEHEYGRSYEYSWAR